MADATPCGQSTVKNYIANPLADDSDNEKRINKTENKALREKKEKDKQKEKQFKSRNNFASNVRGFAPSSFPFPMQPFRKPMPFQFGFTGMSGPRFLIGCFNCGKPNHQREDCRELKSDKQDEERI